MNKLASKVISNMNAFIKAFVGALHLIGHHILEVPQLLVNHDYINVERHLKPEDRKCPVMARISRTDEHVCVVQVMPSSSSKT